MGLSELYPDIFHFYVDNPLILDRLVTNTIILDKERMLLSTLSELSTLERYRVLNDEFDRVAVWMYDYQVVTMSDANGAPALDAAINPALRGGPTTLMAILRNIERQLEPSPTTKAFIEAMQVLYHIFNKTLLQ